MGIGGDGTATAEMTSACDPEDAGLLSCLVLLRRDPQAATLAAAWGCLPAAINSGILTIVRVWGNGP